MHQNARRHVARVTLLDRIALAFGGLVLGALTLVAYTIAAGLVAPKAGVALAGLFLSPFGLGCLGACGVAGFILGPARLADLFGLLWGNHAFWTTHRGRWVAAVVAIALAAALILMREAGHRSS